MMFLVSRSESPVVSKEPPMNPRLLLGLVPLFALALFAVADDTKDAPHPLLRGPFLDCARACDDCARMCEVCGAHCANLVADGKREHVHTLRTCQDCATHCSAASSITARQGPFSDLICQACAEACKRCGDACEKHAHDEIMRKCAEECRKCEKACRAMLKHLGEHSKPM